MSPKLALKIRRSFPILTPPGLQATDRAIIAFQATTPDTDDFDPSIRTAHAQILRKFLIMIYPYGELMIPFEIPDVR